MEIDTPAEVSPAKKDVNESAEPAESAQQYPKEVAESEDKSHQEDGQAITAPKSIKVDSPQVNELVLLKRHTCMAIVG